MTSKITEKLDLEGKHYHPLEAIHFFRRWPRSFARDFVYTFIFNALISLIVAFILLLLIPFKSFGLFQSTLIQVLVIGNIVGFTFWAVVALLGPMMAHVNRQSFLVIALFFVVVNMAVLMGGMFLLAYFKGDENMRHWIFSWQQLRADLFISICIALILATIWRRRVDELNTQFRLAEEKAVTEAANLAAVQANLRILQAQIEPHFLFNTLSNVLSLIRTQPELAQSMLEKFTHYLRASLDATRADHSTLGNEFQLMESYLSILHVRMGARLQVHITLPQTLSALRLPPMLLQPLIENAVQHGIDPRIEGGVIALTAASEGDFLEITISDNGIGFSDPRSHGLGLKNVRDRLTNLYRGSASLKIEEQVGGGTKVVLRLPQTIQ
jgi:sensor histidine kinase YesM